MRADQAGNMREVYLEIARRAEETAQRVDEQRGPLNAEIIDSKVPLWHVLRTEPGAERIAAAHLSGRRFGVYVPEFEKPIPASSVRPARVELRRLFPGYLFIFVWDVLAHRGRIYACPGVMRLLYDGERPAVVPDPMIERMQAIEFGMIKIGKRPRGRRRHRPADDEIVRVRCYAAVDAIYGLDDAGRVSALHKALGLKVNS
jgi:hypothetical protein